MNLQLLDDELLQMARNIPPVQLPNYAGTGHKSVDAALIGELADTQITMIALPEACRNGSGEVKSIIRGHVGDLWNFERAWRYWVANGPGIHVDIAEVLHKHFGTEVRVDGHCGCPSPREWFRGFGCGRYHIDTHRGLRALAHTLTHTLAISRV